MRRITEHPILEFPERPVVRFKFQDREMEGFEGDTIASALHANGVRELSRSHRHHRPRGFFCAIGKCSSCLMTVDGQASVRICTEPLKEGMDVWMQSPTGGELKW